ncbi:MAG: Gfo/Idh/MocA family oxidoreductase [Ignavibacteriae bacterium]|nr:Gfo/Idh/MocA family oxidoreductase [Ignavibacteriota bacterium]
MKSIRKICFAIIGCGHIGKKYADILTNGSVPYAKLLGVCDSIKEKADNISNQFGGSSFSNMHQMMKEIGEKIDVVCILTESGYHAKNLFELVSYKKDFLVEKPLGMNQIECFRMIEEVEKKGNRLFVVKQNRYNPLVKSVKETLENKVLGEIFLASFRLRCCRSQEYYDEAAWRGTKKLDGGVLSNQAIHYIDLLQWYMGMPNSVYAEGFLFGSEIEMEDTAVAIFHFPSGAIGTLEATTAVRPKNLEGSIDLLGSKGSALIRGESLNYLEMRYLDGNKYVDVYDGNKQFIYKNGHVDYLNEVTQVILKNEKPKIDGYMAIKSIQILDALYKSIRTKQRIQLCI